MLMNRRGDRTGCCKSLGRLYWSDNKSIRISDFPDKLTEMCGRTKFSTLNIGQHQRASTSKPSVDQKFAPISNKLVRLRLLCLTAGRGSREFIKSRQSVSLRFFLFGFTGGQRLFLSSPFQQADGFEYIFDVYTYEVHSD